MLRRSIPWARYPETPYEGKGEKKVKGQVVIGTVEGDVHDIGKNLSKMMFEVSGFTVYDIGRDVRLEKFVEEQLKTDSEIVALSVLMTTSMLVMPKAIGMIRDRILM